MNHAAPGAPPVVHYLARPGGRIAYTVHEPAAHRRAGGPARRSAPPPLVVGVPGMGDLRATFRGLVDPLTEAGYRFAVMDLRGHGDSDAAFSEHGDDATGRDLVALIERLGGPAAVLGSSMGGSAGAWAAAERPDLVSGLVLFDPLLRNPPFGILTRAAMRLSFRAALRRPWGPRLWGAYYRAINRGERAAWLDEHAAAVAANLREPARMRALRRLALQLDHAVTQRRLGEVRAPMRVFVGALDPDYRDPLAEAQWMAGLGARVEVIDRAGHYPYAQRPDLVVPATLDFLREIRRDGHEDAVPQPRPGSGAREQASRAERDAERG